MLLMQGRTWIFQCNCFFGFLKFSLFARLFAGTTLEGSGNVSLMATQSDPVAKPNWGRLCETDSSGSPWPPSTGRTWLSAERWARPPRERSPGKPATLQPSQEFPGFDRTIYALITLIGPLYQCYEKARCIFSWRIYLKSCGAL